MLLTKRRQRSKDSPEDTHHQHSRITFRSLQENSTRIDVQLNVRKHRFTAILGGEYVPEEEHRHGIGRGPGIWPGFLLAGIHLAGRPARDWPASSESTSHLTGGGEASAQGWGRRSEIKHTRVAEPSTPQKYTNYKLSSFRILKF